MQGKRRWLALLGAVALIAAGALLAIAVTGDESDGPAAAPTPSPSDPAGSPSSPNVQPDEPGVAPSTPTAGSGDPDEPVTGPGPGTGFPGQEPSPQVVEPRPGMSNVRPVSWNDYEILNERSVRVFFTSGIEPCYVLDRAEVRYSPERVTVSLFVGSDPQAGNVACIEIAVFKAVDVRLDEPLGGRPVVDGHRQ